LAGIESRVRQDPDAIRRAEDAEMQPLVRGLTWPIISLIAIGATHLLAELVRPELHDVVGPAVVTPIYLVAGAWAAVATIRSGGSIAAGFVAGAVLGLLPAMLQIVGFQVLLGRDSAAATTGAFFGWLGVFWGGALGTGLAQLPAAGTREAR
jgi:hypothetical protein